MPEIPAADVKMMVVDVIAAALQSANCDPKAVVPEASLKGDLEADSLDLIDIVCRIEHGMRDLSAQCGAVLRSNVIRMEDIDTNTDWDGTAPGTVGRLQVIAKRMAQPQQAE